MLLLLVLLLLLRLPGVPKAPAPHPDVGDWWVLYDYGLEEVATWPQDYQHPYPGERHECSRMPGMPWTL